MTDRLTLPASVIEDVTSRTLHDHLYRPDVDPGDIVLGLTGQDYRPLGVVGPARILDMQRRQVVIGHTVEDHHTATAWLRVGGVEQGPRPMPGARVIALAVQRPKGQHLVGQVGRVDFVGYDAIDRLGPLVVFTEPDGTEHRTRVTEWVILPAEDDGMGEATAAMDRAFNEIGPPPGWAAKTGGARLAPAAKSGEGRTVGSLTAGDIGRWVEIDAERGITGSVTTPDARHGRIVSYKVHIVFEIMVAVNLELDTGRSVTWAADTPCRVSDGPGEG